jgi:hypothetical protein
MSGLPTTRSGPPRGRRSRVFPGSIQGVCPRTLCAGGDYTVRSLDPENDCRYGFRSSLLGAECCRLCGRREVLIDSSCPKLWMPASLTPVFGGFAF